MTFKTAKQQNATSAPREEVHEPTQIGSVAVTKNNAKSVGHNWSKLFLLRTAVLKPKIAYFNQTFAVSTKNFRGPPLLDCMWKFLVGSRRLTRDTRASERPSKLILWRLHIHMWCCAFHGGPSSPSPASSDTSTLKLRAHLPSEQVSSFGHLALKRRPVNTVSLDCRTLPIMIQLVVSIWATD